MENLKITVHLESPVILDRFLSIDSIIVGTYYRFLEMIGKKSDFKDDVDDIDFISKNKGVLSGSIWYIEPEDQIKHDFTTFYKKSEVKIMKEAMSSKTLQKDGAGLFKNASLSGEVLFVKKIHFYINGDKNKIEKLLNLEPVGLKFIGKKSSLGYGKVSFVSIESISEDKGHFIDEFTPSKPLPCSRFSVDSKKVAQYRNRPPYWLNNDLESCYMPTTAYYEISDNSRNNSSLSVARLASHISSISFVREIIDQDKVRITAELDNRKQRWHSYDNPESPLLCAFTGTLHDKGLVGARHYLSVKKNDFNDRAFANDSDFISDDFLWSISLPVLSGVPSNLYQNGGFVRVPFDGSSEPVLKIGDYISNLNLFSPPFFLGFKNTKNAQHLLLKGKVSVSTGMMALQYGDDTLFVDGDLLGEAISDISRIVSEGNGITKSHLCGLFSDKSHPDLKARYNTEENNRTIEEFQKKYNIAIRKILFLCKSIQ